MTSPKLLVLALAAGLAACTPPPSSVSATATLGTVVDLSHAYGADTVFWPTAEPFKLTVINNGVTDAGFFYAANNFSMAEHGGTHLDAPVHFAAGKHAVDEIPLDSLIGPAVVVDVTDAAALDADYLVKVSDIEAFEAAHGRIPGQRDPADTNGLLKAVAGRGGVSGHGGARRPGRAEAALSGYRSRHGEVAAAEPQGEGRGH